MIILQTRMLIDGAHEVSKVKLTSKELRQKPFVFHSDKKFGISYHIMKILVRLNSKVMN